MRFAGLLSLVLPFLLAAPLRSDDTPESAKRAAQLERAKKSATEEEYLLRYRFAPKEVVSWKVVHLATTETRIQGNTQTSQSRSVSTKRWEVTVVDKDGQITFVHSVPNVNMWQSVSGRADVRYNSERDATPPPEYEFVAKTVGIPLSTVTITPSGRLVKREDTQAKHFDLGLGQIVLPLPEAKIRIGKSWDVPGEISVRLADGRLQRVTTRQWLTLEKVETGIATIEIKTDVLTPGVMDDPKLKAQLVQQMTKGTIKFDLDKGQFLSKQVDWNEVVVAFNGPQSQMQYLARFTEERLPEQVVEAKPPTPAKEPRAKTADARPLRLFPEDKPALRR